MKRSWIFVLLLALVAAGPLQGQGTGRLTGIVRNNQGQPIANASVMIQGTRIGTLSTVEGRYLLPAVPAGTQTVVASLVGYGDATQRVSVAANQLVTLDFQLEVRAVKLEGITAVGYGTQSTRTVTGSVATVSTAQLVEMPTQSALKALQDRVPGVDILQSSSLPGAGVSIRIRGNRSITASNEPLYVVDGIPIAGGIDDLNPSDIASIDVLKDASATATYGSRGANGVVLVTTKGMGTGGVQTQFTADVSIASQTPTRLPEMMDIYEYTKMYVDAFNYKGATIAPDSLNIFQTTQQFDAYKKGIGTDWLDFIKRTGMLQQYQLGMSGVSGTTRFNLSASYYDQTGMSPGFDFGRTTGSVAVDHTQGRLRLGITGNFVHSLQETALGDGLWGAAMQQSGYGSPYDENGLVVTHPDGDPLVWNPLKALEGVRNDQTRDRIFASGFANFNLLQGVDLRVNFGPDYTHQATGHFEGGDAIYPGHADRQATYNQYTAFNYVLDNLLQVDRDFGGDHHLNATLLYGMEKRKTTTANQGAFQIPYDEALYYAMGQGQNFSLSTNLSERAMQYYMARGAYTFRNRYTLSGGIRREGSSVLAEGHKWTTFPSVGAAWQIGDEPFMEGLGWLSSLKLRGSYGVSGNASINPYQTQGALSRSMYNWGLTTAPGYTFSSTNPANPNLTWERTAQYNYAADFGLFNNRITGTVEYYRTNTYDLLLRRTLPTTSGYSSALQNIGKTKNNGFEIALSTTNLENWHGLRWQTDLGWAHNDGQIVELASADTVGCPAKYRPCDRNNTWFVGLPISGVYYQYQMDGIWQLGQEAEAAKVGSKPGQIHIIDQNGSNSINASDRVILGTNEPDWTANIYNRFNWKSLDLSVLAVVRWGYMMQDPYVPPLYGRYGNVKADYWTPTNPSNKNPAPNTDGQAVAFGEARGYIDGSHWRIRNIQLGYTLPANLAGRVGASNARLYATATEPFLFTPKSMKYFDPEAGGGAPPYRTLLVGARVAF